MVDKYLITFVKKLNYNFGNYFITNNIKHFKYSKYTIILYLNLYLYINIKKCIIGIYL